MKNGLFFSLLIASSSLNAMDQNKPQTLIQPISGLGLIAAELNGADAKRNAEQIAIQEDDCKKHATARASLQNKLSKESPADQDAIKTILTAMNRMNKKLPAVLQNKILTQTNELHVQRGFKGHTDWIQSVATYQTSEGRKAITGSDDRTARVWNLTTGTCEHVLTGHTGAIYGVAVFQITDGWKAITGSSDCKARIWDLMTGKCEHILNGHQGTVSSVAIYQDAGDLKAITVASDRTAQIWNLTNRTFERELTGHPDWIESMAVYETSEGWKAVMGYGANQKRSTALIWNLTTGKCELELAGHSQWIRNIAAYKAVDGWKAITVSGDSTARIWNLTTGKCEHILKDHWDRIKGLAVYQTTDGWKAITGSHDHTARVWNLTTGKCEQILSGTRSTFCGITTYLDDKQGLKILCGTSDGILHQGGYGPADPTKIFDRLYKKQELKPASKDKGDEKTEVNNEK